MGKSGSNGKAMRKTLSDGSVVTKKVRDDGTVVIRKEYTDGKVVKKYVKPDHTVIRRVIRTDGITEVQKTYPDGRRETYKEKTKKTTDRRKQDMGSSNLLKKLLAVLAAVAVLVLLAFVVKGCASNKGGGSLDAGAESETQTGETAGGAGAETADGGAPGADPGMSLAETAVPGVEEAVEEMEAGGEAEEAVPESTEATSMVTDDAQVTFTPHCTESTNPANMIEFTGIAVNDAEVADVSTYAPWYSGLNFGVGSDYTDMDGIITFRGNNFRNNPTYGHSNMVAHKFETAYIKSIGNMTSAGKNWSGSGWTGQPLMVRWPASTKAIMNMYDWAKADDDLVEVIYACLDGNIYFFDLNTGEPTRDTMSVGFVFKGAGALDPRGYPLMYVGSGYTRDDGTSMAFIINLIDCSVMYSFGNVDPYSMRAGVSFFDSSALVDAETDTLIYPGENGLLYLIHLNTAYDEAAGTLSINPDPVVKWRYKGRRSDSNGQYWLGMEDSACIYQGYMFVADNGGHLMCLDLNTLQLVWVQDTLDDTNGSPVLSVENGHLYLYISTSFHLGWRSNDVATIPVWKIDADNGEIVWQKDYSCYSISGVSGGVQSTIALGANQLSDYIYVTVSRVGSGYGGVMDCINKNTGEVVWEHAATYAWSSPVCVYNEDGSGVVVYGDGAGSMYMLDGLNGTLYDEIELTSGSPIEASPAVYNGMLVVGTRAQSIFGIHLT